MYVYIPPLAHLLQAIYIHPTLCMRWTSHKKHTLTIFLGSVKMEQSRLFLYIRILAAKHVCICLYSLCVHYFRTPSNF